MVIRLKPVTAPGCAWCSQFAESTLISFKLIASVPEDR